MNVTQLYVIARVERQLNEDRVVTWSDLNELINYNGGMTLSRHDRVEVREYLRKRLGMAD